MSPLPELKKTVTSDCGNHSGFVQAMCRLNTSYTRGVYVCVDPADRLIILCLILYIYMHCYNNRPKLLCIITLNRQRKLETFSLIALESNVFIYCFVFLFTWSDRRRCWTSCRLLATPLTVFAIPPPRIKTHRISSRNCCLLLFLHRYKYTLSTTLNTHVDRYIRLECRRLYSV